MDLRYQHQHCEMSLREGVEEYHAYLEAIGRKRMVDRAGSRLILEHDVTHVVFGMDTSLEQEAGLDTWVIFGCRYQWRYLRDYGRLPEIKALYKSLVKEGGWQLFLKLYWKCLGLKWRIFRRTRRMSDKWPFQFPEEWLDHSVSALRAQHGIRILTVEERETGALLTWSGQY